MIAKGRFIDRWTTARRSRAEAKDRHFGLSLSLSAGSQDEFAIRRTLGLKALQLTRAFHAEHVART